jgi:hypothetical protein
MTVLSEHEDSSRDTSVYVKTHCGTCAAGWTRRGPDGLTLYWCLLDRAQAWPSMEYCSRYTPERREDKPKESAAPVFDSSGDPERQH